MKILLVHNEYQQPGGEDIVFQQERQLLSKFGHTVVTYTRSNREMGRSIIPPSLKMAPRLVWAEDSRQAVARMLEKCRPDIAHVHNTFLQISPSIYTACRDHGVPVVQTLHNFRTLCPAANFYRNGHVCEECVDRGLWRSVVHGCYRGSRTASAAVAFLLLGVHRKLETWNKNIDAYIALTDFAREKFVRGGLPADRIFVKPNFLDPDPGPQFAKQGYAVFVGRLSEEKDPWTLLRAWRKLKASIPLLIIGDGPLRRDLEAFAIQSNLSNVSFLGQLRREETLIAIRFASALILSSSCYENFPMTIVEAFAGATPVLCSGHGAMQEIVEDGRTGLHFLPGSPDDLAQKLEWLWAHPLHLKDMGTQARRDFELKYTADRNHSQLMDIYNQTVRAVPSPPDNEPIVIEDMPRPLPFCT